MAGIQGRGMPLISELARTWRQHFDDESWRDSGYAFLAEWIFCVPLFCGVTESVVRRFKAQHASTLFCDSLSWSTATMLGATLADTETPPV